MRPIDADALKESLKESRDNCSLWLQDCKEARSQKWIGRAEQALMTFNECIMRIDTIPTIEPGRKTGKWIYVECIDGEGLGAVAWKCSECGEIYKNDYNYCPHCGSRNEVEDD